MPERVQTIAFQRARLPHWLVADHSYFVTLCRKGCLPTSVVAELRIERQQLLQNRDAACQRQAIMMQRQQFLKVEAILDSAARGSRDLCAPAIAAIILESLDWLRLNHWKIWAATLMPSHMHMVLRSVAGENDALRHYLASFMRYTANKINVLRNQKGAFWQAEPFDHWCRDSWSWQRSVAYTLTNPVKANLCSSWREWPYSCADPDVTSLMNRATTPGARDLRDREPATAPWPSRRSGPTEPPHAP